MNTCNEFHLCSASILWLSVGLWVLLSDHINIWGRGLWASWKGLYISMHKETYAMKRIKLLKSNVDHGENVHSQCYVASFRFWDINSKWLSPSPTVGSKEKVKTEYSLIFTFISKRMCQLKALCPWSVCRALKLKENLRTEEHAEGEINGFHLANWKCVRK